MPKQKQGDKFFDPIDFGEKLGARMERELNAGRIPEPPDLDDPIEDIKEFIAGLDEALKDFDSLKPLLEQATQRMKAITAKVNPLILPIIDPLVDHIVQKQGEVIDAIMKKYVSAQLIESRKQTMLLEKLVAELTGEK